LTAFVPVGIQMLLQTVLLTGLAVMLFIFLMYFTNESQMVYEDTVTDALNRNAFLKHINDSFRKKRDENLFVIALDNFKIVNEVVGIDGGNEIMIMLVDNLQEEYGVRNVFRWGGDVFIVTVPAERESSRDAEIIRRIIQMPYFVKSSMLELGACICLLDTSDMDKDKIAWTIEFAVGKVKNKGKGSYVVIDKSIEQDIRRSVAIEQAIHNSIMSGTFEVHYQPIYDTAHKKIHSMEALARLNVPEFGYVSPEEFIRVAEKNGTIFQIGILVIEEVCKFIKEYDLKKYGIEFVEINLSVVQCMKEHINTDITEAIDKYGIPHDMINLEITESAAGDSEEKLIRTMAQLALSDFTFSLDDYGSGYSNINYIVDLPFSIVKIDKYVVWAAMKDASSRKILENTVKMFKDVHLQIVAEGVEDLDMANILIDMGVDYLQGYYYSKPVPKDKFVDFIREKSYEKIS
jgi:diguanylate cyclase (GGDEF)-like protein